MRVLGILLTVAVIAIVAGPLQASSSNLRCDGRIVAVGDSRARVARLCGQPDETESWEEAVHGYQSWFYDYRYQRYRLPYLVEGPVHMERWTYDFGSNRLLHFLTFANGALIRINTGDRGNP